MHQIIKGANIIALLILNINCCFIVHFVYYGALPEYDYQRISKFNYPYILHLDEEIKLPNNITLNRTLTPVEKSDIKKMEVIYHHGGLYLDNDHFIDPECVKKVLCHFNDGMYVLDWTEKVFNYWQKAVPISFIYSMHPKNSTIFKILTSYNQSINQTIYFSGPFHAQKFRQQISFMKINSKCEYHIGIQSWNNLKNSQYGWLIKKLNFTKKEISDEEILIQASRRELYQKLWKTHTVIYPQGFNYSQVLSLSSEFNHVQILNNRLMDIKVIKFSQIQNIKQKLDQFISTLSQKSKDFQNLTIKHKNQPQSGIIKAKPKQNTHKTIIRLSVLQKFQQIIVQFFIIGCFCILLSKLIKNLTRNSQNYGEIDDQNAMSSTSMVQYDEGTQPQMNDLQSKIVMQTQKKIYLIFDFVEKYGYKFILPMLAFILLVIFSTITFYLRQQQRKNIHSLQNTSQFQIKWVPPAHYKFIYPLIGLKQLGIYKDIHTDSVYDYLMTTQTEEYFTFQQNFVAKLKYSQIIFNVTKVQQNKLPQKIFTQNKQNNVQIESLKNQIQSTNNIQQIYNQTQLYLASYLVFNRESETIANLEHYYFNKKYNTDKVANETPICVITTESEMHTPSKFEDYFASLERQNYSNYHVVLIDDNSPDHASQKWQSHLENSNSKLRNRVRIVRNYQKIGILASRYAYVQKFCGRDDVVVNLYLEDQLIGYQAFNVLNSVYQDPNVWYAYSKILSLDANQNKLQFGNEVNISQKHILFLRTQIFQQLPRMRSYRQRLMQKIPISQLIQYKFNNVSQNILPEFPKIGVDMYETYPLLQLCGPNRIKFIQQPLVLTLKPTQYSLCYKQQILYYQYKVKSKNQLKPLIRLNQSVLYHPKSIHQQNFLIAFRDRYNQYSKCKQLLQIQNNLI